MKVPVKRTESSVSMVLTTTGTEDPSEPIELVDADTGEPFQGVQLRIDVGYLEEKGCRAKSCSSD